MGLPIHNEQSVPRIEREGAGVREIHLEGWTVAVEAELAGPGDGVNDPGLHIDAADAVASGIADVQIALRIECHIQRQVQPRLCSGPAIAAVTGFPDTSHVADDARCQLDPAHAIGPGLRIVEGLGLRVDRDTNRQRHACLRSRLAVPCAAGFPVACKGLDDANGYDATVHRRPLTSNCGPHAFGAPISQAVARRETEMTAARRRAGSLAQAPRQERAPRLAAGSALVAHWPPLRWRPLHAPTS